MGEFRFSHRVEADLLNIGNYTLGSWSEAQAVPYLVELEARCQRLADNPASGRFLR